MTKRNVWIVIDDIPEEFGQPSILAVYDNKKAADCHSKAYRQEDEYAHQYTTVQSYTLRSTSILLPVRKRA